MKKFFTLSVILFAATSVFAQNRVGIGTSTPQSKLDVVGKIRGTELQVTTNPQTGFVLTSDSVGNATWEHPGILDSLVLRDSTGDIRMIMNPNTGTFKMLDNDTVWYSIQVNSPSYETRDLGEGMKQETYTASNGDRIERWTQDDVSTRITTTSNDGAGNTTVSHTNYTNGIRETLSTTVNGTISTYSTFDVITGDEESRKTYEPNKTTTTLLHPNGNKKFEEVNDGTSGTGFYVTTRTWFDINGVPKGDEKDDSNGSNGPTTTWTQATGESTSASGGILTIDDPNVSVANYESDHFDFEIPTEDVTAGFGLITSGATTGAEITCDDQASGTGAGIFINPTTEEITVDAKVVSIENGDAAIRLDVTNEDPTIFLIENDGGTLRTAKVAWKPASSPPIFEIEVKPTLLGTNFTGLAFDPIGDVLYGSAENILWRIDYNDPASSVVAIDLVDDVPKVELDFYDPDISDFRSSRLFWDAVEDDFKIEVSDPISGNSCGVNFDAFNNQYNINADVCEIQGENSKWVFDADYGLDDDLRLSFQPWALAFNSEMTIFSDANSQSFKINATDNTSGNSVAVHFVPSGDYMEFSASEVHNDGEMFVTGDVNAGSNLNVIGNVALAGGGIYGVTELETEVVKAFAFAALTPATTIDLQSDVDAGGSDISSIGNLQASNINASNILSTNNINPIAPSTTVTVNGNMQVNGTLNAMVKLFSIDHPLDPENQKLNHACIESDEMVNIYSGKITTDENGYATVQMENWMTALNTDFRYQLTVIGDFSQAIVAEEISNNNSFVIRTEKPNVKVSWEVIGVRQDKWALENPLEVEVAK